jgi:SSS family solute:Na+ symporter
LLTIIPGLIALAVIPKLGAPKGELTYNNAIPLLMGRYLPNGALGVALAGLLAAFMAGMAANISSFNTVFTYDIGYFYPHHVYDPTHATINAQMLNFYGAIAAFVADLVVTVLVSLATKPKPVSELGGLVWGVPDPNAPDPASVPKPVWWKSPKLLGGGALGITLVLSVIFA